MKFILSLFAVLLFSFVAFGQTERDRGIALYRSQDYEAAIGALQTAVKADEKDRDAWLYLGMSLAQTKRKKEAVKAFRKGDSLAVNQSSPLYDKELKIISKPRCTYTDAARQNMTQGVIKFAVEFGADQKIKSIVPFETLPDGLTQYCTEAVKGIKFEAASKNGTPISVVKVIEYSFRIY